MMSPKKLMKMLRKWEKPVSSGMKRISRSGCESDFIISIRQGCLHSNIDEELFKMYEEEFGLSRDSPITMLFNVVSMKYVVSLVQRSIAKDIERALLNSIAFTLSPFAAAVHTSVWINKFPFSISEGNTSCCAYQCVDQQVPFLDQ
ncbi:auxin-responsive protein SAUR62-like [Rhodamnia argentea]|uniref:Auxin-responsive protein SAUR62-like n=1 Tax=Rhodamnia argentea TaxID=178133 RepID=A0ABM3HG98_9MYRT|nr:auxin-responsive protein SAUR62-like [Rhodamnia argentea]